MHTSLIQNAIYLLLPERGFILWRQALLQASFSSSSSSTRPSLLLAWQAPPPLLLRCACACVCVCVRGVSPGWDPPMARPLRASLRAASKTPCVRWGRRYCECCCRRRNRRVPEGANHQVGHQLESGRGTELNGRRNGAYVSISHHSAKCIKEGDQ